MTRLITQNVLTDKTNRSSETSCNDFHIVKQIGSGNFGSVYRLKSEVKGLINKFVLKKANENLDEHKIVEAILEKTSTERNKAVYLTKLNHILPEMFLSKHTKNVIIMEDCGRSLDKLSMYAFSKENIEDTIFQMYQATNELHDLQLYHMDIKLANVCMNDNGKVKLIDLGMMIVDSFIVVDELPLGTSVYLNNFDDDDKNDPVRVMRKRDLWATSCVICEIILAHRKSEYKLFLEYLNDRKLDTGENPFILLFYFVSASKEHLRKKLNELFGDFFDRKLAFKKKLIDVIVEASNIKSENSPSVTNGGNKKEKNKPKSVKIKLAPDLTVLKSNITHKELMQKIKDSKQFLSEIRIDF